MLRADIVRRIDKHIREFSIGYFSLVMSTGIISIAAVFIGIKPVGRLFFQFNLIAYGALCLLTILRSFRYLPNLIADMMNYTHGAGFLTTVAGTCILGSQFVIVEGNVTAGLFFLLLGALLWGFLFYTFFFAMIIHPVKPASGEGINGTWLIAVVATQSVSILGIIVAKDFPAFKETFLCFSLALYLLGCFLYFLTITLIVYRLLQLPLSATQFSPPYWINMGAAAITTLAGAQLIVQEPNWLLVAEMLPFLKACTFFSWVTATWWIPLLIILEFWRHLYKRVHVQYHSDYWDMVFPLGMYSACTSQLSHAIAIPFFYTIAYYFFFAALLLWVLVFAGLIHRFYTSLSVYRLRKSMPLEGIS